MLGNGKGDDVDDDVGHGRKRFRNLLKRATIEVLTFSGSGFFLHEGVP